MKKTFGIIAMLVILITACKDDNEDTNSTTPPPPTPVIAPVISSFLPEEGLIGDLIVISGSDFSSSEVFFNGIKASIIGTGTDGKSLTVKVPEGASTGKISIVKQGITTTSTKDFKVIPLSISDFKSFMTAGIDYTITGTGFNSTTKAYINDLEALILNSTNTTLRIIIPAEAKSGKIKLTGSGQTVLSATNVTIVKITLFFDGSGGGNLGAGSTFSNNYGLCIDKQDNVIIADGLGDRLLQLNQDKTFVTLAGSNPEGYSDGAAASAKFNLPAGIAYNSNGDLVIADYNNNRMRSLIAGEVSTLAGNGTRASVDGTALNAQLAGPLCTAIDANNNIYVSENSSVRKISASGIVTTFAGSTTFGYADGTGNAAQFSGIRGLAFDVQGNLYVADGSNNRIRKITPQGVVSTYVGGDVKGFIDGDKSVALLNGPSAITITKDGIIYFLENGNKALRQITADGKVSTVATFSFDDLWAITTDSKGNIYLTNSSLVRKVTFQ